MEGATSGWGQLGLRLLSAAANAMLLTLSWGVAIVLWITGILIALTLLGAGRYSIMQDTRNKEAQRKAQVWVGTEGQSE
jgi:hypothetical protein